jgi:hypothetical protein
MILLKPYEIARNNRQTTYQSKLHTTVQSNSIYSLRLLRNMLVHNTYIYQVRRKYFFILVGCINSHNELLMNCSFVWHHHHFCFYFLLYLYLKPTILLSIIIISLYHIVANQCQSAKTVLARQQVVLVVVVVVVVVVSTTRADYVLLRFVVSSSSFAVF